MKNKKVQIFVICYYVIIITLTFLEIFFPLGMQKYFTYALMAWLIFVVLSSGSLPNYSPFRRNDLPKPEHNIKLLTVVILAFPLILGICIIEGFS